MWLCIQYCFSSHLCCLHWLRLYSLHDRSTPFESLWLRSQNAYSMEPLLAFRRAYSRKSMIKAFQRWDYDLKNSACFLNQPGHVPWRRPSTAWRCSRLSSHRSIPAARRRYRRAICHGGNHRLRRLDSSEMRHSSSFLGLIIPRIIHCNLLLLLYLKLVLCLVVIGWG